MTRKRKQLHSVLWWSNRDDKEQQIGRIPMGDELRLQDGVNELAGRTVWRTLASSSQPGAATALLINSEREDTNSP